jgi:hypothetical protein
LRLAESPGEWTTCQNAIGATIFHSWEWLSWIAPRVNCRFVPLLVQRGGETVGLAPMLVRSSKLWQTANVLPFPVGPLVHAELLAQTSSLVKRWAIRHRIVSLTLTVHPTSGAPEGALAEAGLNEISDETFLIDLAGKTVDEVFASFSSDARSAIRRSVKRGVSIRPSTPEELSELLPKLYEEAVGQTVIYARGLGQGVASAAVPFPVHCATAVVEGRPVGVSIATGGANAVGLIGGVFREHQSTQANSALVWDAVQWAHAEGCSWLDMLGAPDPGIAAFKRKFKPRALHQPQATWQMPGIATAKRWRQSLRPPLSSPSLARSVRGSAVDG